MQSSIRILFFCFLFGQINPLHAQWQSLQGPSGGFLWDVFSNSQFAFLTTSDGIYRSGNGGEFWQKPAAGLQAEYFMAMLDVNEDQQLAYSTDNTFHGKKWLQLSSDQGNTWATIPLPDTFPVNPEGAIIGDHIILADYDHIWESQDAGLSWAVSPLDGTVQYIQSIISEQQKFYIAGSKLAVSEPGGQNFHLKNFSWNGDASDLIVIDSFLFAYDEYQERFYRSVNDGTTWKSTSPTHLGNSRHQVVRLNDTFYTLNGDHVAYSNNNGLSWITLPTVPKEYGSSGYILASQGHLLVASSYSGILRATSVQGPWLKGDYGIANGMVSDLEFSDNYLFAGAGYTGLFRYDLDAESWDSLNLWPVRSQFTDAWTQNGYLYATREIPQTAFEPTVGRSADDGLTWTDISPFYALNRVTGNQQSLFVWYTEDFPAGVGSQHYKSDNQGDSWINLDSVVSSQIPGLYLGDMAVQENDLWLVTQHGSVHSSDNGLHWVEQNAGLPAANSYAAMGRVFLADSLVFIERNKQLFRSADNGSSWQAATSGLPFLYDDYNLVINALIRFDGKLLIGNPYGLYVSTDEGLHWAWYPGEFPNDAIVRSMKVHDNELYVGTTYRGVWKGPIQEFSTEKISGRAYWDDNNNGIQDPGEQGIGGLVIQFDAYNQVTQTDDLGNYELYAHFDTTQHHLTAFNNNLPHTVVSPGTYTTSQGADNLNFAVYKMPGLRDLTVYLSLGGPPRPGATSAYYLQAFNHGTTTENATVETVLDPTFVVLSITPAPDETIGDTLRWHLQNFGYLDKKTYQIQVALPSFTPLGQVITSTAGIRPVDGDIFPSDNIAVSNDIVVGSYDPNEKSEVHNGSIFRESVESGEALVYTIHFQNTGTYPAEKVVIADQLDPLLHAASLQVLTASHPFTWTLQGDGRLEFTFDMIDLPDSMTSQAGSQGFVSFAVKIRPEAPVNSLISNFAAIYFDLNTPVITKTISTRILEKVITTTTDPAPTNIFGLSVSPNPSPAEFNLQWPANIVASRLEVFTIDGRLLAQTQPGAGHTAILNLTTQPEGIYFAVLTDRQGKHYPAKLLLLKR